MGHKIRQGMIVRDALYDLHGLVEADEIFIGGKQTLAERRKSGNSKTPFFMAVQENDHGGPEFVTFEEIEGVYETQILPAIEKHIKKGSKIVSDGELIYLLCGHGFEFLEETEMFEIKQGPYRSREEDKEMIE